MNRQLTLASQHKDLQKGDLIAVGVGGNIYVGVYSQLTKRDVVRFIPIDKDLSRGKGRNRYNSQTGTYDFTKEADYTYERRFEVEWSRRCGSYTGYGEGVKFDGSSFVPYHIDLLTEEQKVNYQKIRQFLRCSDDN